MYTMVMSWQAQLSKPLSMCQGTELHGDHGVHPSRTSLPPGNGRLCVLALLHVLGKCLCRALPVAARQAMGLDSITPYAPSRCCTVFSHCLAVPEGLSELLAMRQAELGQTTWSLHMGWQGSLPKDVTGAKLDVSICPHFLSSRNPWCLAGGGSWLG